MSDLTVYGATNAFFEHRAAAREALARVETNTAQLPFPNSITQQLLATKRTVSDVLDRIVVSAGVFGGPDFPARLAAEADLLSRPWDDAVRGDYAPPAVTAAFALSNNETSNPRYTVPKRSIREAADSILAATAELRRHAPATH